ncbi:hypothetical protein GKE82_01370 [Conexibacter sp. W3-3-2]|uniref:PKD domain-containing protein n=1 Tax=Paraconexibacter algicola TaxID=2133960 RepID=A0A2T4UC26_9ACTN|nr:MULTISPECIES: type II secretion system GspH family protein [Solirubrobacterales]MTD42988.1 hypothetical protein [Conexibacter sp. W3-3-2]PTL54757.1 hypothetical protein C7Y72_19370 [Paraconexibacter algicola]
MSAAATVRARLAAERGEMSLTGLLVAIVIFAFILTATLTTYDSYSRGQRQTSDVIDAQQAARAAIDRLARDLRNLSSPTPDQPQAFDAAGPYDLVFKTVDPNGPNAGSNALNVKRMRYCLDVAKPEAARLVAQTQTWTTATPPAVPSTTACPGSGWPQTTVLATALVNRAGGRDRPVFLVNSTDLTAISAVHAELFVDLDTARNPPETTMSTGVFLRNQNRRPTAAFTATPSAQGILLNGSTSSDPEGESLTYRWYDNGALVGTGITFTAPAAAGTSHTIQLRVSDPAGLEGVSATQAVVA